MKEAGKQTEERMAGKGNLSGNLVMRILAGLVSVFMIFMIPVAFVCVEGWWRKLCVLSIASFAFLFGRYSLEGGMGACTQGGREGREVAQRGENG